MPHSTVDLLAARLTTLITDDLRETMSRLAAQDVPPIVTAHVMLRLAATVIRDAEGANALRTTVAETLNDLISPRI